MGAFMAVTFLVVLVQDIPLGNYLERVERERIVTALERDAFLLAGRSEDTLEAERHRIRGSWRTYTATAKPAELGWSSRPPTAPPS